MPIRESNESGRPSIILWGGYPFTHGEVRELYHVGDYHIIEYHPFGPQDRAAKSWYEKDEVTYRDVVRYEVYRTGVTGYPEGIFRPFAIFDTLDAALANAIAVKHDGTGTRADQYFMRSIWLG